MAEQLDKQVAEYEDWIKANGGARTHGQHFVITLIADWRRRGEIIERLPKTADGVPVTLYGTYYVIVELGRVQRIVPSHMKFKWNEAQDVLTYYVKGSDGFTHDLVCKTSELYSTREAALAAQQKEAEDE